MTTIHLQMLGQVPAQPVETLVAGQKTCWNQSYGEYEVVSVKQVSPQFMLLTERKINTGVEYARRVKKGRLIGVTHPTA